jgi:hypothetical protein
MNRVTPREIPPEPADNIPDLRVIFTNYTDREPEQIRIERNQPGIPSESEISKLSPPSYQESTGFNREDQDKVPSYEEVMAHSDSFVVTNPVHQESRYR